MKKYLIPFLLILTCLCVTGAAESAHQPGNIPERGLILPMTEEDVAMGLSVSYAIAQTADGTELPTLQMFYCDFDAMEAVMVEYTEEDLADEENSWEIIYELYEHFHILSQTALFDKDVYDAQMKDGLTLQQLTGSSSSYVLGENDGYVYVTVDLAAGKTFDDPVLTEKISAAAARANDLLKHAEFQNVVFAPGEFGGFADVFPSFSTQDLNGSTITNSIFAARDLTVVNIWGTFCNPCINEMPELAAWSAEMPENVQIIGLVSDLASSEDAETLELARAICEATGVTFTNLIANADFAPLLSGVVGVPTTVFVDKTGTIVGDPIVGANVPGYKSFVETYLHEQ